MLFRSPMRSQTSFPPRFGRWNSRSGLRLGIRKGSLPKPTFSPARQSRQMWVQRCRKRSLRPPGSCRLRPDRKGLFEIFGRGLFAEEKVPFPCKKRIPAIFRRDSFDLKCTDYGVDFPGGVGPGVSRKPVPLRHSVPEERRTSSCFAGLCVQALHLPE